MAEVTQSWKKTSNTEIVGGETALDGSNSTDVDTGLDVIVSATVTISNSSTPGVGTSVLTYSASGGTLSIWAWKVTASGNATLVASTGTETVSYVVVGY